MKTRTLLLLALGCGILIVLAGGAQLIRLSGSPSQSEPLRFGVVGQAGDANVSVQSFQDSGAQLVVSVVISGVDDDGGLSGFRLVGAGAVSEVDIRSIDTTCTGLTQAVSTCTLAFDTSAMGAGERRLLFSRADVQLRWKLA